MTNTNLTLDEYSDFALLSEQVVLRDDVNSMKWIGLAQTKQFIQKEMYHLAYYMEKAQTNPECIPLREMYRLSILNSATEMKKTIDELQTRR
jgi:hypothetical protein